MSKLIDVLGKVLLVVMLISTILTASWWVTNWGSYRSLRTVMDDRVEVALTENLEKKPLFVLTPMGAGYIVLNYSAQMIDMSNYLAEVFALKTVLKNGGSQEDYDSGVKELNSKYMFYKELPEEYDIFNKYIDLDNNSEPVDVESDIAGQVAIEMEDTLKKLSVYDAIHDISFGCIKLTAFIFLVEFLIRKFSKKESA